jgi:hypothetical protein
MTEKTSPTPKPTDLDQLRLDNARKRDRERYLAARAALPLLPRLWHLLAVEGLNRLISWYIAATGFAPKASFPVDIWWQPSILHQK